MRHEDFFAERGPGRMWRGLDPKDTVGSDPRHDAGTGEEPGMPRVLFEAKFDAPDLTAWTSYVGGEDEDTPSWEILEESLQQPIVDGLLRAILTGSSDWLHYDVHTRLRFEDGPGSSRAGLVFRDDGRGFYVLRVSKGESKAQLMYHSRAPFGWHELATVPLGDQAFTADWIELRAEVRGPFIRCFVNGSQFLDVADSRAKSGRAGFYCCEAKVRFDHITIEAREPLSWAGSTPFAPSMSYWFRETFAEKDNPNWTFPSPWIIGGAVCLRPPAGNGSAWCRLDNLPVTDGIVQVQLRPSEAGLDQVLGSLPPQTRQSLDESLVAGSDPAAPPFTPDATTVPGRAGLILRGQGRRYYALLLDRAGLKVTLCFRDDDHGLEEMLAEAQFRDPPEDRWYSLIVQMKGDQFLAFLDGVPCIQASDSRMTHGYLGLFAESGPTLFTDLLSASGT